MTHFLLRFDPSTDLKNQSNIDIPKKIKLGDVDYTYLSGIVHLGPMRENGHYTCVTSCPDGSFASFDDLQVCAPYKYFILIC